MADRYRTGDGWSVEVVRLTCTPDRHDGEWCWRHPYLVTARQRPATLFGYLLTDPGDPQLP